MCVFNGLEDTRACLESLRATTEPFRLVVMDNGSTDGTTEFFTRFPYPYPLTFARSPANDGVIAALNRAWRLADTRSEEHTSELQSRLHLVCRLLLEKKKHT